MSRIPVTSMVKEDHQVRNHRNSSLHDKSSSCPGKYIKCIYCGKTGHCIKMCMKNICKVHEKVGIVANQSKEICLEGEAYKDGQYNVFNYTKGQYLTIQKGHNCT